MSKRKQKQADTTCPKCGRTDLLIRWYASGTARLKVSGGRCHCSICDPKGFREAQAIGEHLYYHCRTCQYEWTGPTVGKEMK